MNWWLWTGLVLAWIFLALLMVSVLGTVLGPITGPLGERRTPLVEAVAVFCLTVMFLGTMVILGR